MDNVGEEEFGPFNSITLVKYKYTAIDKLPRRIWIIGIFLLAWLLPEEAATDTFRPVAVVMTLLEETL